VKLVSRSGEVLVAMKKRGELGVVVPVGRV
jgi:hypothetical protein